VQRFEGKIAVVTGGAGGIGAAVVRRLTDEGAAVVIADADAGAASALAGELRASGRQALGVPVDVEHEDQVASLIATTVAEFGGLDVLHNNAALTAPEVIGRDGAVADIDADLWDRVMRVNLRGYVLGAKHAIPHLLARRGVIVNTASGAGVQAELARPAYGTAKAAVIGFTRNVATQYGRFGLRCVAIAPGLVLTPALRENLPESALTMMARHVLGDALGTPEDIAAAVAFLASPEARYINGVTLAVDGGFSVHTPSYADELEMMAAMTSPT
jgi:NAD(P)-dependent dehydrogenase (short-subunit alcohol dehydrogenase family)